MTDELIISVGQDSDHSNDLEEDNYAEYVEEDVAAPGPSFSLIAALKRVYEIVGSLGCRKLNPAADPSFYH
ncbi:hypothetical protein EVAR_92909_1 [Eumeta japonica]|uniref:Uncharacterized protein n=1 Tax=Eumeta variegata TaxID=151549 RepID=A0A4C1TDC5_EUMVA|nr:hypothetical protein EVAR_92909_1 [Eumeta japonica]